LDKRPSSIDIVLAELADIVAKRNPLAKPIRLKRLPRRGGGAASHEPNRRQPNKTARLLGFDAGMTPQQRRTKVPPQALAWCEARLDAISHSRPLRLRRRTDPGHNQEVIR